MNISWTKWQTFDNCHLQYHLTYVQKAWCIKPRLAYLVGSVAHDVIKAWAERGYPQGFIEYATVQQYKRTSRGIFFRGKGAAIKTLRKAVAGSILAERTYRLMGFPEHGAIIEERFKLPFPSSPGDFIVGGVDIYDPVVAGVYDLKMGTGTDIPDRRQILIYALAEILKGRAVNTMGFITPLKPQKVATEDVTKAMVREQAEAMLASLQQMKQGFVVEPTTGKHCIFCGYRSTTHCSATSKGLF